MKLAPLVLSILVSACCPSWAADQEQQRFVEFEHLGQTQTYDLSTVQMLHPGRFTIVSTTIDDGDVMKFELKALDTLRAYCKRPDGKYPAPTDLFTLGPPDMPIGSIDVKHYSKLSSKNVVWDYPYTRLAVNTAKGMTIQMQQLWDCNDALDTLQNVGSTEERERKWYRMKRASIMNGFRHKELFDCKRGLRGDFWNDDDDPEGVFTTFVEPQTYSDRVYRTICLRVAHETPYSPE